MIRNIIHGWFLSFIGIGICTMSTLLFFEVVQTKESIPKIAEIGAFLAGCALLILPKSKIEELIEKGAKKVGGIKD